MALTDDRAVESSTWRRGRVLMAVDSLLAGGAEQHVVDLAAELGRRGWRVTVACSVLACDVSAGVRTADRLEADGVRVLPLLDRLVKRRVSDRYASALQRVLALETFDLLHAHIYASVVAATVAGRRTGTPVVITEHTEAPWRDPIAQLVSRCAYRRAERIMVVSEAIRTLLGRQYGVDASALRLVPPVGAASASIREHPPGRDRAAAPVIGFVGRLCPEKGVDILVRALPSVLARRKDVHLVIVGDGPEAQRLRRLAGDLDIADRVRFTGHRDDVGELLGSFSVLAVPSLSDGAPLTIHEAMLAGVPVIGSRVGGIPDRLRGGRLGTLVAPGDPAPLAEALCAVIEHPERYRRVAALAQRTAEGMTFPAMVDAIERVYAEVLRTRAARRGA